MQDRCLSDNGLRGADGRRGAAIVEFAVGFPLLLLLCFGAGDFARIFVSGITVTHAAASASSYGSLLNVNAVQYGTMQAIATNDADDVQRAGGISAVAQSYCDCPSAPASGPGDANAVLCDSTCTGYGMPRVFVRTTVSQTLDPITSSLPGIPSSVPIGQTSFMRVQ